MATKLEQRVSRKFDEIPSVKDFGAVGNGTKDDTKAIQKALDQVGGKGEGGELYFPLGRYVISKTLQVRHALHLRGTGFGDLTDHSTNIMQSPNTALVWKAGSGAGTMVHFKAEESDHTLHGGGMRGIFLDAVNEASVCVRVSSARETELDLATFRPTQTAVLLDDTNGRLLDSVRIPRLVARIGGNPAVAAANGIHIKGNLSGGGKGCTNVWMGDIDVEYDNSDGVIFEEVDSSIVVRLKGNDRRLVESPGRAAVFRNGGGAFPAQKNVIVHLARGRVLVEDRCVANRILYWNSEGGRTHLIGGASNLSYTVSDRVHGDTFQGGTLYPMKENLNLLPGSLQKGGAATDAAIGSRGWGGVMLPASQVGEVRFSLPPPDTFNNGRIFGVRIYSFASAGAATNDVRLTLEMVAIGEGASADAAERSTTEVVALPPASGVLKVIELRFPTGQQINYHRGEWLAGILRRTGNHPTDNSPQGFVIGGLQLLYECDGPTDPGSGPWQVPRDQLG